MLEVATQEMLRNNGIQGLYSFLQNNRDEILQATEEKTNEIAGFRPESDELRKGLPIFYEQFIKVLQTGAAVTESSADDDSKLDETEVTKSAAIHGQELQRQGYTLSHVVHAYGSMCQAITELAMKKNVPISNDDFHELNHFLDVAIAGAVSAFQAQSDVAQSNLEIQQLGFLAHELRNALSTVTLSFQILKAGTVGFGGSTNIVLEQGLKRMERLIDQTLTEVRLRVEPKIHPEVFFIKQVTDEIIMTAKVEAIEKKQIIEINIDPTLSIATDRQFFFSALSNLIQNAIKFTPTRGKIQVRAKLVEENIVLEVQDECGGLLNPSNIFKPFTQDNTNKTGLGLGLTITHRAIMLNHGTIEAINLEKKGCIFKITLPKAVIL